MTPFHARYGLLPTQIPIGEGPYAKVLNQTIPYYDKLISGIKACVDRIKIYIIKGTKSEDD